MLNCGDTFLTGDEEDLDLHLWIIISPPSEGVGCDRKRYHQTQTFRNAGGCSIRVIILLLLMNP